MTDATLERLLTRTAGAVEYPPAPDLSARVQAALSQPAAPSRTALTRRAFGYALLAALLFLAAALAISPNRDAIARLFGVEGSKIEFLPTALPGVTATPLPTAAPTTSPLPRAIAPVDLARLPELAGFESALPNVDDQRLSSSLVFYADQPVVMHHYQRFDLWQTQLKIDAGFGKGIPGDGRVDEVEVGNVPGIWVSGGEHFVYYYDSTGQAYSASQRTVERNTLIWRTEAFFYRLETDLTLEEALSIAETLP